MIYIPTSEFLKDARSCKIENELEKELEKDTLIDPAILRRLKDYSNLSGQYVGSELD